MNKGILMGLLLALAGGVQAANTPCSGMKGGISHCEGRFFICNDGTHSASKKDCNAEGYASAPKKAATVQADASPDAGTEPGDSGSAAKPRHHRAKH